MSKPIRILLISTLYPSEARPVHGIFVETRLRELLKSGKVEAKVIAPVPWFPFKGKKFGEYGQYAATPKFELRNGIEVHHPRYVHLPRVGMNRAPAAIAKAVLPIARKLQAEGFDFDLIDAHYYYPDGVAAAIVAKALGKPFVVTARGTDLNLIPEFDKPRAMILRTALAAQASIGVCRALMDRLAELGADPAKLNVFRNGVDLERFVPEDRNVARIKLGLNPDCRHLLSVGHLIERKGHHLAIETLPNQPVTTQLTIIGSGPEKENLIEHARRMGVRSRVHFTGQVPQDMLKWWYSAADVLLLGSSREGWANVLLESMACGTPVVATNIWGTPEVVSDPAAGVLAVDRTPEGVRAALDQLLANYPDRAATRRHAEQFSWDKTTQDQLDLFAKILSAGSPA